MAQKFPDGSIVWLKSGSPAMTVNTFHNPTQRYRCVWFTGDDDNYGQFYENALTDSDPSKN
ncbi:DUF2158 domain-containing protein [Mesonia aquimarina]|uniref:DUF2158 domain-containing protein n=1 Tax=Mesonia aquimarina TaxID=1504967 RepID=UPI000EF59B44|nr:DUF2158 domain-containing protein [Mesonia aquimarina]